MLLQHQNHPKTFHLSMLLKMEALSTVGSFSAEGNQFFVSGAGRWRFCFGRKDNFTQHLTSTLQMGLERAKFCYFGLFFDPLGNFFLKKCPNFEGCIYGNFFIKVRCIDFHVVKILVN